MTTTRPPATVFGLAELAVDDATLAGWLREDAPYGDLSTAALPVALRHGRMRFHARGAMRVACTEEAVRLVQLAGAQAGRIQPSGATVGAGELLLHAEGPAPALLLAWKVAQTLVEVASGMATAAAAIVDVLEAAGVPRPVACTRKTVPGTRALAAKAVRAGGAVMHRLGLSETLLLFPEHRTFLSSAQTAAVLAKLRAALPEKRLVVETTEADEALALALAGAEVLQLEPRFTPARLAELRARLNAQGLHPVLAPAGGVTVDNAVAYARAGADLLVTSAPYLAPRADVQVRIEPAD